MYWQNTLCLCTLDSRLMKQLLNTKRNWVQPHTHTGWATPYVCDTHCVWRYDKAERNFLIPPPLWTSLCPRVWHTLAPSALQLCTPAYTAAGVSCFSDEATLRQWAAMRTVRERGGNSPPITCLSLPGNRGGLREGPPAVWKNGKQTKKKRTLTNRWVTRVLVGFAPVYSFSGPLTSLRPTAFVFHSWLACCFAFWQEGEKGHRETKQSKCGNFCLLRFSLSLMSFYQH